MTQGLVAAGLAMLLAACGDATAGTTAAHDSSSTGHVAQGSRAGAATTSPAGTALYEIYVAPPRGADSAGSWGRAPGQAYARRLDNVTRAVTAQLHLGPSLDARMLVSGSDTVQVFRDEASSLGMDVVHNGKLAQSWKVPGSPADVTGVVNGYPCQQSSAMELTCGLPGQAPATSYQLSAVPSEWGDPGLQDGKPVIKAGPGIGSVHASDVFTAPNGDVVIVEGSRTGTIVENATAGIQLPLPHLGAIDAAAVRGTDLLLVADDTQNSSAFEQPLRIDLSTMQIAQRSVLPVQPGRTDWSHAEIAQTAANGPLWAYVSTLGPGDIPRGQLYRVGPSGATAITTPVNAGLHTTQLGDGSLYFYGGIAKNVVTSYEPASGKWHSNAAALSAPDGTEIMALGQA